MTHHFDLSYPPPLNCRNWGKKKVFSCQLWSGKSNPGAILASRSQPLIDWTMGEVTISSFPRTPRHNSPATITQWYLICYLGMDPDHKITHLWKKRMNRHAKEAYSIRKTMLATELAQQMEKPKAKLPQSYANFRDVFEKKTINELPPSRTFDHTIELNEGFSPKVAKVYPLNPKEQEACRTFVDEHLKSGKIILSKSPQASPFFFVPKKDRSVRPCQDYWYLNSHTVKNAYPLPLISNLIDKLKGSSIFTKMDIQWGYNDVLIKSEDRWKAAFVTPLGLFDPLCFPSLWLTWQMHLWLGTSIHLSLCKRTCLPSKIWPQTLLCLPPTNWQRNRESKSGARNLPPHLLQWTPWKMGRPSPHGRILSQLCDPLHHQQVTVFPHPQIWTEFLPPNQKNLHPHPRNMPERTRRLQKRSPGSTQKSTENNKGMDLLQVPPMEIWR